MFECVKIVYDVDEERAIFNSLEDAIYDIDKKDIIIKWEDYDSTWIRKGQTSDKNIYYLIREKEIGKWDT